jgi:uncharacterized RDD family membrane protein YckC
MNAAPAAATPPAGFWIRLVAFAVDLVVIGVAQLVLALAAAARWGSATDTSGGVGFFTLVFAIAYPAVLHALVGQTLGKLVTGVRVVAVDGGLLPFGAALLRAFAAWLGLLVTLGVGHVIGGLRKDKRALHDLIAGSRAERLPRPVVPRRSVPRATPPPAAPPPPAPPAPVPPTPVPAPAAPAPQGPFHRPPSPESEPRAGA